MSNRGRGRGRGRGFHFPELPNKEEIDLWRLYNHRVPKIRNKGSQYNYQNKIQGDNSPIANKAESSTANAEKFKDVLQEEPMFFQNSPIDTVLIVDLDQLKGINDPWKVKQIYFDSNNIPCPDGKNRFYYESLLRETESVDITHNFNNAKQLSCNIGYSKCLIKKVMSPSMWGFDLNKSRQISSGALFNYWDYIDAWNYAFLYQNPQQRHSWFFKFCSEAYKSGFPNWYIQWWEKFGSSINILPAPISNLFEEWAEINPKFKVSRKIKGQDTLYYMAEFGLPWIFKWEFKTAFNQLNLPVIQRTYWIRWWNKYDTIDEKVEEITQATINYSKEDPIRANMNIREKELKEKESNPFQYIKAALKAEFPQITEEELLIKCMDHLRESFIKTFDEKEKNTEDNSVAAMSTSEAEDDNIEDSNQYTCLAGEGQEYEEPTMGDIWDSMTTLISAMKRDKEKDKVIQLD